MVFDGDDNLAKNETVDENAKTSEMCPVEGTVDSSKKVSYHMAFLPYPGGSYFPPSVSRLDA